MVLDQAKLVQPVAVVRLLWLVQMEVEDMEGEGDLDTRPGLQDQVG